MQKKTDFTLVELIVIVTIIGILSSLLMSAMRYGIQRSKDIVCKGQLTDKGKAFFLYGADNNNNQPRGHLPPQGDPDYWLNAFAKYQGYSDVLSPQVEATSSFYPKYTCLGIDVNGRHEVPEVLRCPFRADDGYMGYGWNMEFVTWRSLGTSFNEESQKTEYIGFIPIKQGQVLYQNNGVAADLTEQVVMGDNSDESTKHHTSKIGKPGDANYSLLSKRHSNGEAVGGNYLFMDGHVEWKGADYLLSVESLNTFWRVLE